MMAYFPWTSTASVLTMRSIIALLFALVTIGTIARQ